MEDGTGSQEGERKVKMNETETMQINGKGRKDGKLGKRREINQLGKRQEEKGKE